MQDSEDRFRQLAGALSQIVWVAKPDGDVDWSNDWWYEYTGAERRSNWDDPGAPMHPDDVQPARERWQQSLATGESHEMACRFKRKSDGQYRWHLGRAAPVRNDAGQIERWIGSHTDVHEQKVLEERLGQAQRQTELARGELYQFFMQTPEPMVRLSGPEHVFTLSNPANDQLIGFSPLHRKVRDVFTHDQAGPFFRALDQVYGTGVPFMGKELPFQRAGKAGHMELRWLNIGYYPARDAGGGIDGILGVAHDVTDQVVARKVIEDNEDRVQRYAEAMPQMAFMTDAAGEVTYFNSQHYDYFGVERIEKEGSRWKEQAIVHPDDLQMSIEAWSESVRTGKTYQVQYRLRSRDGVYRWHLARAIPDRDGQGGIRAWYGTNTDIHEQKLVEAKLEEEQRLRERFTHTLAHDLRTPLSTAAMASQFLLRYPPDDGQREQLLRRISESLHRVEEMVSSLLDAGRLQAGHDLPMTVEECNLDDILAQTMSDLVLVHGTRITLRACKAVHGYWNFDGLRRVVENLVTNAAKYGSPDTPITVTLEQSGDRVKLAVHNYGRALSEIERSTLFELFGRSSTAQASGQPGWGIGLAVVKSIVERQGGNVSVDSSVSAGTTFTIELPVDARPFAAAA